jgi:hypothetical protein
MPDLMPEMVVKSTLGEPGTSVLSFTNPLIKSIQVSISLAEGYDQEEPTEPLGEFAILINKKTKHHVGGLDTLEIPFTYTPRKMLSNTATISIVMDDLEWIFPVMVR